MRFLVAVALTAAATALPAHAAMPQRPAVTWLRGEGNYTKASRSPTSIRQIVVHATEGPFWPSVRWLRNHRSHASAHFVVGRRGGIVQLVHQSDIAWHAGNRAVNRGSVGIEHEGIVDDPAGFTLAQYRASARLAAYIARRALMPIDRRHLIGHDEVPHPFDPRLRGGFDGHTDPGRYWSWRVYLRLVRAYAFPRPKAKPERVRLHVASTTVYSGQVIRGRVPWRVRTSGPVERVDFLVDGRVLWRDRRPPFAFAGGRPLETRTLANGPHRLELRAYGSRGSWTRRRIALRVRNTPLALRVPGVSPGATVSGRVRLAPRVRVALRSALLFLDGRPIARDTRAPFRIVWDTARRKDGRRLLELRVHARDGRDATLRLPVVVANAVRILSQSLADGQDVSGVVAWQAEVTGPVRRLEFLVDGAVRGTATRAPWSFAWDTAAEAPGPHVASIRALAANGKTAEAAVEVVVVAPPS